MTNARLHQKLTKINRDPLLTAKAAGLKYVSDTTPGWRREREKEGFSYLDADGQVCTDEEVLLRVKKLALPPAWENVWICANPQGHLQATGVDAKGRKQYRYHHFTAKDFRTWAGTVTAFQSFQLLGPAETATQIKGNILKTIDQVANNLGNTRTVCRKYYIHPVVLTAYEQGDFFKYLAELSLAAEEAAGLSAEEKMVKHLLRKYA